MSIINTQPPKGEIYPATLHTKGEIENLRFAKGQLEKLAAECSFTKPKYTLEETAKSVNAKKFFIRCEVIITRINNSTSRTPILSNIICNDTTFIFEFHSNLTLITTYTTFICFVIF